MEVVSCISGKTVAAQSTDRGDVLLVEKDTGEGHLFVGAFGCREESDDFIRGLLKLEPAPPDARLHTSSKKEYRCERFDPADEVAYSVYEDEDGSQGADVVFTIKQDAA